MCVWDELDFILAQSQPFNNILPNRSIPLPCIVMRLGFAEAGHSIHFLCIVYWVGNVTMWSYGVFKKEERERKRVKITTQLSRDGTQMEVKRSWFCFSLIQLKRNTYSVWKIQSHHFSAKFFIFVEVCKNINVEYIYNSHLCMCCISENCLKVVCYDI